jgi:peptidoglycan/LPS O-acetylase OafA/YrhL
MQLLQPRLETVQFARAVAVLFVVVSHAMHELALLLSGSVVAIDEKRFPGDFGVDLFFVISGFIMVYVSRDAFGRTGATLDFLRRRIIRIVPLYWLMTTLMIAVVVLLPEQINTATSDVGQWLASYFFIPYARASDGLVRPVLGLGWSLQYEMLFYCLFALGLLFPMRRAVALTIILIGAAFVTGQAFFGEATLFRFLSHPIVFEFAAGLIIGYAFVRGFRVRGSICILLAAAGVLLLAAAPSFDDAVDRARHIHYGVPATLLAASAVLFRGVESYRVGPVFLALGESSYATYLVHPFVLGLIAMTARHFDLVRTLPAAVLAGGLVATAIAASLWAGHVVHRQVDTRLTRWANLVLPRPKRMASPGLA